MQEVEQIRLLFKKKKKLNDRIQSSNISVFPDLLSAPGPHVPTDLVVMDNTL